MSTAPVASGDGRGHGGVCEHGALEGGGGPGRCGERDRQLAVDAVGRRGRDGGDRPRLPERPRRQGDRVGAQVEERASREVGPHDAVVGVEPLPHVGDGGPQLPEPALLQDLPHDVELGEEERPHGLHAEDPGVAGRVPDRARLRGVEPHGLLDEDVLPGGDGEQGVGEVVVVRRRDVDDVDVRVGDEGLVGAVRALHTPRGGRPAGGLTAAGPHRRHDLSRVATERGDEPVGDPPGAQHSPAQGGRVEGVGDTRARKSRRHTA